ncbi:MAG: PTS sugar transporter subunit IIA [Clostridium sp.]|nr:PTS sugar transporter subunit IIA [Clostridium sp.]
MLLISHGSMCRGMYESLKLFFGGDLAQTAYIPLEMSDDVDQYRTNIGHKIEELDEGDGVIVLIDILGGTPANNVLSMLGDRVIAMTGMNLPMLIEVFSVRTQVRDISNIDIDEILNCTKDGILCLNRMLCDNS